MLSCHLARIALNRKITREYATYVAIEHGVASVVSKTENGACTRAADPRQCDHGLECIWENPTMIMLYHLGSLMQVAGARVISQPCPVIKHRVYRGAREAGNIGETQDKTLVVGNHRNHLGLLQHDLRNPDAIRIPIALPGQVMTPMGAVPTQYGAAETKDTGIH